MPSTYAMPGSTHLAPAESHVVHSTQTTLKFVYGLIPIAAGADKRVQYRPRGGELDAHVATLAQAYRERPVTLIRVIYALRDHKIQSFADAFRLKGK